MLANYGARPVFVILTGPFRSEFSSGALLRRGLGLAFGRFAFLEVDRELGISMRPMM
jgi:hypothetical protein